MALAVISSTNSPDPQNLNPLIGENYKLKLIQSIQNLLAEIHKESPNFSHFVQQFYELMQSRVDPPLESIWVYAALKFRSENHTKVEALDRISAAKDLFQLISACSASCSSSKSVALLAPVAHEVHTVVADLFKIEFASKREKKAMKEAKSLVGAILGYMNVCCLSHLGENDGVNLITPFSGLIRVWMNSSEGVEDFLPLVSSEVVEGISEREGDVGYLAGVVAAEVFLLKLCLDVKVGTSREELEMELRTWAVASITGLKSFYLFEVLVTMMLEKTLPVTPLLNSEDEALLRKVLSDAIILVEYSFLSPERVIHIPVEHMKSISMKRLILTYEAMEHFRKHGDQRRAISYVTAFSTSQLSSHIIKWVKNQIPMEDGAIISNGASPKALIKWLLTLEDQGFRIFDDSTVKFRTKLALDISRSDSEQPAWKPESKQVDDDLLFYIDNKGDEEHTDEENEEVNKSMSAAFFAAAHTMVSSEKRGKKRKEKDVEKTKKIKFVKYDLQNSDSASGRSSFTHTDSSLNIASEDDVSESEEE